MNGRLFHAWVIGILFAALSGCASVATRPVAQPVQEPDEFPMVSAFVNPLPGSHTISPFGQRGGRQHHGVDLKKAAGGGDIVVAARDARVETARRCRGYGLTVVLLHPDGSHTRYAHLRKILVDEHQKVAAGQQIGIVGATGRASTAHLHYEVLNRRGKVIDPIPYLQPAIRTNPPKETASETHNIQWENSGGPHLDTPPAKR